MLIYLFNGVVILFIFVVRWLLLFACFAATCLCLVDCVLSVVYVGLVLMILFFCLCLVWFACVVV